MRSTSTSSTRSHDVEQTGDADHRRRFARVTWRHRWRRARPYAIGVLGLGVVAAVVWLFYLSTTFAATQVEVAGSTEVPVSRIERAAAVPLGGPLARVDLDAVEQRVAALPPVEEVQVSRGWPDAVRITVTDRVPVAALAVDGSWQVVDAQGQTWGSFTTAPRGLPVVRARDGVRGAAVTEAARVVSALPRSLVTRLQEVQVRTIDQISLTLDDGPAVSWGSAEQSALKAEVLASLLGSEEAMLVDGEPAGEVDVSVPTQPTVRR